MCPLCLLTTFLVILLQKQLILIVENLEYKQKKITDNCHSVIATVHILSISLSGLLNIYIIMHTF